MAASAQLTDVLIVGAGPVGMTLARALTGAGVDVVVIDRQAPAELTALPYDGRAWALAPASRRALQAIGVWPDLAARAEAIQGMRISDSDSDGDGDSQAFLSFDQTELGSEPLAHMIENRVLRRALLRHHPVRAASLSDCRPEAATLGLELSDGTRFRTRLLVAADGRHSATREAAGIALHGWRYDQVGIVCTVRHQKPHQGVAYERFLSPGPFAMLPLKGRRSSLVWCERPVTAAALMAADEDSFNAELAARCGDAVGSVELCGRRWSYPLALHLAESYVGHRLALVGDAAHGMHPVAGQGLNLGLRDAAALAEVVVEALRLGLDPGAADVLARYQTWRRFDGLLLLAITDGLNRLFGAQAEPVRLARRLGLAAVGRLPQLQRLFRHQASGSMGELPRLLRGAAL
jgi:2-octaprenyl-6-methoxyphenol hydroxylase